MKRKLNRKNLVILLACLITVIAIIVGVFFYIKYQEKQYNTKSPIAVQLLPMHEYDLSLLKENEKGQYTYTSSGGISAKHGIDVSSHQKEIDWQKVKDEGIEFAFIRLGYRGYQSGEMNLDEYFHANIKAAQEVGIEVGVYFFSQAINEDEVLEEANFVLKEIKGYELQYPIVYDLEDIVGYEYRTSGLTKEEKTRLAMVFAGRIENQGYHPMIYTNLTWSNHHFSLEEILNYDIWFAQYNHTPDFNFNFNIWQYTDSGKINGVNTPVDLNLDFSNCLN